MAANAAGISNRPQGRAAVSWSPRVAKTRIRRLYESDARGLLDEELLDDIGTALYLRCRDILTIEEAKYGKVLCPRCDREGVRSICPRPGRARQGVIECGRCGWRIVWADYLRTFKRRQLNIGGAAAAFRRFVREWPREKSPREKMLLIDRLIHEFHYALNHPRYEAGQPTRAVCVNLIRGKLTDVVAFLDELTHGERAAPEMLAARDAWRENLHRAGAWHPKGGIP